MTLQELAEWHEGEAAKATAKAAEKREEVSAKQIIWNRSQSEASAARADALARFHREAAFILTESATKAA